MTIISGLNEQVTVHRDWGCSGLFVHSQFTSRHVFSSTSQLTGMQSVASTKFLYLRTGQATALSYHISSPRLRDQFIICLPHTRRIRLRGSDLLSFGTSLQHSCAPFDALPQYSIHQVDCHVWVLDHFQEGFEVLHVLLDLLYLAMSYLLVNLAYSV